MLGEPIVFSASIGQGHNQAAKAIKNELEKEGFSHVTVIDTLYWIHPFLHQFIEGAYKWILRYHPYVWDKVFHSSDDSVHLLFLYKTFIRFFSKRIEAFIEEKNPPFIISTHPCATLLIAEAKERRNWPIPLHSVITDFKLHPTYVHKYVTNYFTIDETAEQFANLHGLNPSCFHQTGIPFPAKAPTTSESDSFRKRLNIPTNHAVILIAGGGVGLSSFQVILKELEQVTIPLTIFCMIGHNQLAKRKLRRYHSKHNVCVVPFTDQFISYLAISDILITKAGGLTLSEALACEIPVVLYEPLPGHEEQNAMTAVRWGAAIRAFEREQISGYIELILTNQAIRNQMILSARQHKKQNVAKEIVRSIIERRQPSLFAGDVHVALRSKEKS